MKLHQECSIEELSVERQQQIKHHTNKMLLIFFIMLIIGGIAFAAIQSYIVGEYFEKRWQQHITEVMEK